MNYYSYNVTGSGLDKSQKTILSVLGVLALLIIIGGIVAGGFLVAFLWAVRSGQYDDTVSPSVRILYEEKKVKKTKNNSETWYRSYFA